jgi:chromosomal replication initiator protein
MLAMWLARKYTRAGLTEIGRYFGRRSHSTVLSAQRQVERWLANGNTLRAAGRDLPVQEAVRRVESQLRTA